MLQKIDNYLIDEVFQKLAEKYQLKTNRTNFNLAIIIFTVFFIADIPEKLAFSVENGFSLNALLTTLISLAFYGYIYYRIQLCKILERTYKDKDESIEFNRLRSAESGLRLFALATMSTLIGIYIMLFIFTIDFSLIASTVGKASLIIGMYFSACVPVPGKRTG